MLCTKCNNDNPVSRFAPKAVDGGMLQSPLVLLPTIEFHRCPEMRIIYFGPGRPLLDQRLEPVGDEPFSTP
jgi:hypothetical protein